MAKSTSNPKGLRLQSRAPILVGSKGFLKGVNALRKAHGAGKKHKQPITLAQLLAGTRVVGPCSDDHASLSLSIHYVDSDGMPCTRRFPNFGLQVESRSTMQSSGGDLAIAVDVSVKAGKPKWQADEVRDCVAALSAKQALLTLEYTSSTACDWSGNSTSVEALDAKTSRSGIGGLPVSAFVVSTE